MKIELSHDILARKIYDKASAEDKLILKIENLIHEDYLRYLDRNLLMNAEDYEYVAPFLDSVNISDEENDFIVRSKRSIDQKKRARNILIFSIIGILTLLGGLATYQSVIATSHEREAVRQAELAQQEREAALLARAEADRLRKAAEKSADDAKASAVEAERQATFAERQRQIAVVKEKEARKQAQIAEKEKEAADKARGEAEILRIKAEENAIEAKRNADEAEKNAIEARENAKIALNNEKKAKENEAEANRLKNLFSARVDANNAIRLIAEGKLLPGADLAVKAYESNENNRGPEYNADCYQALDAAYQAFIKKNLSKMDDDEVGPFYRTQDAAIRCIATAYTPKRKDITAYATEDRHLIVVDANGPQKPILLAQRPRSITFSHDGKLLLVGTFSGELQAFEYFNGKFEERKLHINNVQGEINFIKSVSPKKGYYFITFATPSTMYIGTIQKDTKRSSSMTFNTKQRIGLNNITATAFSQDGKYALLTNQQEFQVHQLNYNLSNYNIESSRIVETKSLKAKKDDKKTLQVSSAAIGKQGDKYLFALGFRSGLVHITNSDSLKCLIDLDGCTYGIPSEHKSAITKLIFSKDGKQLISSSLDRTAKIWNVSTLNHTNSEDERIPLVSHRKWIWDVAYNYDQNTIYTVSEDRTIRIWLTDTSLLENRVRDYIFQERRKNGNKPTGYRSNGK